MDPKRKPTDRLGRPLRDLRLSLTDQCNLRCSYCMPKEVFGPGYPFLPKEALLADAEIVRLAACFVRLGALKLRLTGGEPLLRPGLPGLVAALAGIDGVEDLSLTTNGLLLPRWAEPLAKAGLERVNVSLDSLDPQTYRRLSGGRGRPEAALAGIEAALRAGLEVKVNTVVKRGVNDGEILALAEHFRGLGPTLRFIEYMDAGNANGWRLEEVVPSREILDALSAKFPLRPLAPAYRGEVARRYAYRDGAGEIGLISSVTQPFCGDCHRARLSADGKLHTCLFATEGSDLRPLLRGGASDEELLSFVAGVWGRREDRYSELRERLSARTRGRRAEMSYLGG